MPRDFTDLTPDKANEILSYNPKTGSLTWRVKHGPRITPGDDAGCTRKDGMIVVTINGEVWLAHRLIWFMQTKHLPENRLTFKNKNRADLRWKNIIPEIGHDQPISDRAIRMREWRQNRRARINDGGIPLEHLAGLKHKR